MGTLSWRYFYIWTFKSFSHARVLRYNALYKLVSQAAWWAHFSPILQFYKQHCRTVLHAGLQSPLPQTQLPEGSRGQGSRNAAVMTNPPPPGLWMGTFLPAVSHSTLVPAPAPYVCFRDHLLNSLTFPKTIPSA